MLAADERSFGPSTALLRYGQGFRSSGVKPAWLRPGRKRDCFNNAATVAHARSDVFYTEGYALEPRLPIPIQHAWLVDASGEVIDPTWENAKDNVYFGIAFDRDFVVELLKKNEGQAGVLVSMYLLHRHFRDPVAIENAIRGGVVNLP